MATFSDMATLLLTFFILLLSFAQLDVIDFREAIGSIREAFGATEAQVGQFQALSAQPVELNNQPTTRLTNINQVEQQAIQSLRAALARAARKQSKATTSTSTKTKAAEGLDMSKLLNGILIVMIAVLLVDKFKVLEQ